MPSMHVEKVRSRAWAQRVGPFFDFYEIMDELNGIRLGPGSPVALVYKPSSSEDLTAVRAQALRFAKWADAFPNIHVVLSEQPDGTLMVVLSSMRPNEKVRMILRDTWQSLTTDA